MESLFCKWPKRNGFHLGLWLTRELFVDDEGASKFASLVTGRISRSRRILSLNRTCEWVTLHRFLRVGWLAAWEFNQMVKSEWINKIMSVFFCSDHHLKWELSYIDQENNGIQNCNPYWAADFLKSKFPSEALPTTDSTHWGSLRSSSLKKTAGTQQESRLFSGASC